MNSIRLSTKNIFNNNVHLYLNSVTSYETINSNNILDLKLEIWRRVLNRLHACLLAIDVNMYFPPSITPVPLENI
jgi:hypothetical protein